MEKSMDVYEAAKAMIESVDYSDMFSLAQLLWFAEFGYRAGLYTIEYLVTTRTFVADMAAE